MGLCWVSGAGGALIGFAGTVIRHWPDSDDTFGQTNRVMEMVSSGVVVPLVAPLAAGRGQGAVLRGAEGTASSSSSSSGGRQSKAIGRAAAPLFRIGNRHNGVKPQDAKFCRRRMPLARGSVRYPR
ncbi:hypothetical protein PLESTB_001299500 [Pleodorina starrii]|uniref:Uncharacterized protein n=1 Tax=Pleodorina starrii TaxID=330485 RepID=A0A9W6BUZ0_9CHLO|nr:hypothetical protein PLESTM_000857400 [Pleodorina starrii]GLC57966.1 hypothetical protein PLESTB_001299500 [Pleodorina starrii]GLC76762.1 hypothetical protein PLESTF_001830900 [Pleodorina starrii]